MQFKVGNIVKTPSGSLIKLKKFSTIEKEWGGEYDVVEFKFCDKSSYSGVMRVIGHTYPNHQCDCWYDPFFRAYKSESPDPDCEICHGSGEYEWYIHGLNDCVLICDNLKDYKKWKLEAKLKKIQEKLEKLNKNK